MEKEVIFSQKIAELLPVYQALFWALEIHQRTNCIRIPAFLETPFCLGLLFLLLLLFFLLLTSRFATLSIYLDDAFSIATHLPIHYLAPSSKQLCGVGIITLIVWMGKLRLRV